MAPSIMQVAIYHLLVRELTIFLDRGVRQAADGLRQVAEALELVESKQERWWEPDLYRLQGALLWEVSSDNHTEAET